MTQNPCPPIDRGSIPKCGALLNGRFAPYHTAKRIGFMLIGALLVIMYVYLPLFKMVSKRRITSDQMVWCITVLLQLNLTAQRVADSPQLRRRLRSCLLAPTQARQQPKFFFLRRGCEQRIARPRSRPRPQRKCL